jgi:hypothetical protein
MFTERHELNIYTRLRLFGTCRGVPGLICGGKSGIVTFVAMRSQK